MTPLSPSSTSLNTYLLQQPTQYHTLNFQCESSFLVIVVSFLGHVVCGIFVPWLRVKFTPTALETQSLKGPPGESLQFLCSWSCTWRQYLRFNRPRKAVQPKHVQIAADGAGVGVWWQQCGLARHLQAGAGWRPARRDAGPPKGNGDDKGSLSSKTGYHRWPQNLQGISS